jgi:hypothetical protein
VNAAGYSTTPLPRKLGIKPGARVVLVAAPTEAQTLIAPLPDGAVMRSQLRGEADVIVFFALRLRDLDRRFEALERGLARDGSLWIAWPKRTSGVETDLTENVVRELGLARGLVDTKVCAISDVWSGLRFVRRLRDR